MKKHYPHDKMSGLELENTSARPMSTGSSVMWKGSDNTGVEGRVWHRRQNRPFLGNSLLDTTLPKSDFFFI